MDTTELNHRRNIHHLILRAGFGSSPNAYTDLYSKSIEEVVSMLFIEATKIEPLTYIQDPLKGRDEEVSNFKVLLMILKSKPKLEELNLEWLEKMANCRFGLREKMTLFWHNFFACSAPFAWLMQVQNNFIRQNAFGDFRTLLHGIAKDPAMIIYLNNQQNKKKSPNENFAREVMELFSLGNGNYSEADIKEVARCFTGWTANKSGKFEINLEDHDAGEKSVFGRKGFFTGEQIIDMLLENPKTAENVVRKMYQEFVNVQIDEQRVKSLAADFFHSGYAIKPLMESIFLSDWFYDSNNLGSKICAPIEWLVRLKKFTGFIMDDNKNLVRIQRKLGQTLFFPPNVGGWPGGRNWIDSNSLLMRLSIPLTIALGEKIIIENKKGFDNEEKEELGKNNSIRFSADWRELESFLNRVSLDEFLNFLFQVDLSLVKQHAFVKEYETKKNQQAINFIAKCMAIPEFQLI
jgi:uncharacterized protein (DUF1800 family)